MLRQASAAASKAKTHAGWISPPRHKTDTTTSTRKESAMKTKTKVKAGGMPGAGKGG